MYQIFIPEGNEAHFGQLIIESAHLEVLHAGENHTLDSVRRKFWIANEQRKVQRVLKRCVSCRKTFSLTFRYPEASDLPEKQTFLKRWLCRAVPSEMQRRPDKGVCAGNHLYYNPCTTYRSHQEAVGKIVSIWIQKVRIQKSRSR